MKKRLLAIPAAALIVMVVGYIIVSSQKTNIIINSDIGIYNSLRIISLAGIVLCMVCTLVFAVVITVKLLAASKARLEIQDFIMQQKEKIDKVSSGQKEEVTAALDLIDESLKVFAEALQRTSNSEEFHNSIRELTDILHGTAEYLTDNPEQLKRLRRFLNYYLPATSNYLKTYIDLASRRKSVESRNIEKTLLEIEKIVCEMTDLYKEAYDDLFSDKAMDILAEIAVTKSLMKNEY